MQKLNFTKEHTKIVKGVAILLMLTHHLFAFPDRIHIQPGYISMLSISGKTIEYLLGVFGNICVSMYMFLSGYGIYMSSLKQGKITLRDSFKRIKKLYINYWIVFVVFVPIGFIFFNQELNIRELILNFVGLSSSYNNEWWFFILYIELMLVVPLLNYIIRDDLLKSVINVVGLLVIGKAMGIGIDAGLNLGKIPNLIIYRIKDLIFWQTYFLIGFICAKFGLFSKVMKQFIDSKLDRRIVYALLCVLIVFIRKILGNNLIMDFILMPCFVFAVVNLLYNSVFHKLFRLLGEHSTNMWLIHSFFCYRYFQWLVFKPRLSILILAWLVVLSLVSSYFINYLHKWGSKVFMKYISAHNQKNTTKKRKKLL